MAAGALYAVTFAMSVSVPDPTETSSLRSPTSAIARSTVSSSARTAGSQLDDSAAGDASAIRSTGPAAVRYGPPSLRSTGCSHESFGAVAPDRLVQHRFPDAHIDIR